MHDLYAMLCRESGHMTMFLSNAFDTPTGVTFWGHSDWSILHVYVTGGVPPPRAHSLYGKVANLALLNACVTSGC